MGEENKVLQSNDLIHTKKDNSGRGISNLLGGGISRRSRKKIIKEKYSKESVAGLKQSSMTNLNKNSDYSIPQNDHGTLITEPTNITPSQPQDSSFLPLNLSNSIMNKTVEPPYSLPEITSQASLDYSV